MKHPRERSLRRSPGTAASQQCPRTSVGAGGGIRTPDFLLGKPQASPGFVANQLVLETFIAYKKATKWLTTSGEKWLRVTLGLFLEWLPTTLADADKQHIIQFLSLYEGKPWRRHSFYRAFKTFWKWLAEEYEQWLHGESALEGDE